MPSAQRVGLSEHLTTDSLVRMRCLVTAGNTREAIDSVRMWTNIFTGNTGLRIAQGLTTLGDVDLLTSNEAHWELAKAESRVADEEKLSVVRYRSHADLKRELASLLATTKYDAVFMTAAVADYLPAGAFAVLERKTLPDGREQWIVESAQKPKIKSTHEALAFLGQRSEKLVDLFRTEWRYHGLFVKFKLEVGLSREQLIEVGSASRLASGADYLVANALDMVSGADAGAYLLSDREPEWVPRDGLAQRMVRLVRDVVL